jgi:N-acyl-D-amino-acid deacylase
MIALPPWVQEGGADATLARLRDPAVRRRLAAEWFPNPRIPLENVRLASVPVAEFRHLEGQTLAHAVGRTDPATVCEFVCDLLVACDLAAGCVVPHDSRRTEEDVIALMRHPGMMAGSDGIFVGGRPHPRGRGCFARYLGHHVRETRAWPLEEAVMKLSWHAARRHGLTDRGLLREGFAADLVVFDPDAIADRSTYDDGLAPAVGVSDVVVNGIPVLQDGERTGAHPGRGLLRR